MRGIRSEILSIIPAALVLLFSMFSVIAIGPNASRDACHVALLERLENPSTATFSDETFSVTRGKTMVFGTVSVDDASGGRTSMWSCVVRAGVARVVVAG